MFHIVAVVMNLQGQPMGPPMAYKGVESFSSKAACEAVLNGESFKKALADFSEMLKERIKQPFTIATVCTGGTPDRNA